MSRLRIAWSAALVVLVAFAANDSLATPGPVGEEFPAEDRPLPADGWWKHCSDARGVTTTIEADCVDADCEAPANLYLERSDANGQRLSPRLRVNDGLIIPTYYRVSCNAEGWVVAQWRDAEENCFVHRVIDPAGAVASGPRRTAAEGYDCRARPSVAVQSDGGFLAAWPAARLTMTSGIVVQRFDNEGRPATDVVQVTDRAIGWNRQPKIAIDDSGTALVAWLGESSAGPNPVYARLLDDDGTPLSDLMELNTFAHGTTSPPTVSVEAPGSFLVVWGNALQGGRVARRVSLTASVGATTTRAHSSAAGVTKSLAGAAAKTGSGLPRFGVARTALSAFPAPDLYGRDSYLGASGDGAWLLGTRDAYHLRTDDDGVEWSEPRSIDPYGNDVAVGIDASGVEVVLVLNAAQDTLSVVRSTDGGASWTDAKPLASIGPNSARCGTCWLQRASVAGNGAGTWLAAWTFVDGDHQRVLASRSQDGGKTWGKSQSIAVDAGAGEAGFTLATDAGGTWLVAWLDRELRVARSSDDAGTWSPAATISANAVCEDCATSRHFARLRLAHDAAGRWVMIFASSRLDPAKYGFDGDVFVARSRDRGMTWTAPAAIASYAGSDASREHEPSIATDGAGRWVALWTSYRALDDGDGMDADLVFSLSTDAGATWTTPASALANGTSDASADWAPQLATDERGSWMMTWKTRPFEGGQSSYETTYASVADATCGNAVVELGEACDDGNDVDGDGCDFDCSATGCGNGVVTEGEECDVGHRIDEPRCRFDCTLSRCGDGEHDPDFEECDDGNEAEDDGCSSQCQVPRCGDGVVQAGAEECDDGYGSDHDECTNDCKLPRCGDGIVQDGVEACDDGQLGVPDDACPDTCDRAVCGDGYTSRGYEQCDPQDPNYVSACSEDCRLIDLCGDADGDGALTIIDVQHILGRGVGLDVWCPREPCDMNGDGYVRAGDARMGLSESVGLDVGERCSLGTGNIVFWIDYEGDLGALQVRVDYAATGGSFVGAAGDVACTTIDGNGIEYSAFNDLEAESALYAAMISVVGFHGPVDLFRCAFELPADRGSVGFTIEIQDASTPEFERPNPLPLLGYRLE